MYHTELHEQILTRKRACEQLQKFGEHEQASNRLNFASKSSKGNILPAVKNFNGPFITLDLNDWHFRNGYNASRDLKSDLLSGLEVVKLKRRKQG